MQCTATLLLLLCALTSACVLHRRDRPPEHQMIETAYFICDQCQSAQGGIYGKGPARHFRGANAPECIHRWQRVSHDEFKLHAMKYYHKDWSRESWYWNNNRMPS